MKKFQKSIDEIHNQLVAGDKAQRAALGEDEDEDEEVQTANNNNNAP